MRIAIWPGSVYVSPVSGSVSVIDFETHWPPVPGISFGAAVSQPVCEPATKTGLLPAVHESNTGSPASLYSW